MAHPHRVRVTGLLESFAQGFAAKLLWQGYRPKAATDQVRLLAHLSRWLGSKRLGTADLATPVLNEFLSARRSQGYALWLSSKALVPLLSYLRGMGITVLEPKPASNALQELLDRDREYLLGTRGLTATSARGYVVGVNYLDRSCCLTARCYRAELSFVI
jgi:hypothetical protein